MKTQITAILIVCGALLASASSASAFTRGDNAGELCFFTHCWSQGNGSQTWAAAELDTTDFVQFDTAAAVPEIAPTDEPPVLPSSEFGGCLLNDAPVDSEQLAECHSAACLGRKDYYSSLGAVQ